MNGWKEFEGIKITEGLGGGMLEPRLFCLQTEKGYFIEIFFEISHLGVYFWYRNP